ncbi:hypothetical protein OPT61_g5769 [Boeremia exigua]|uniref:Uncharacterized protein n=1 Tax=Boeremia exigua TaxID=749465 RepID=A0ACC2I970_9PLEO|nr:hypothetical protein OPT61_g5769 [Boeremia exigua]
MSPASHPFTALPVLPLSQALDERTKPRFLADLRDALLNVGFLYLSETGLPDGLVRDVIAECQGFFEKLPQGEKEAIEMKNEKSFLGWSRREKETKALEILPRVRREKDAEAWIQTHYYRRTPCSKPGYLPSCIYQSERSHKIVMQSAITSSSFTGLRIERLLTSSKLDNETTALNTDHREQLDLSTPHPVPGPEAPLYHNLLAPNQWPSPQYLPAFRPVYEEYMRRMSDISILFTSLIAEAIGLQADAFSQFFDEQQQHKLKIVKYPEVDVPDLPAGRRPAQGQHADQLPAAGQQPTGSAGAERQRGVDRLQAH